MTSDLLSFNEKNCLNYENIKKTISTAIYDFFEERKESIFEYYKDPRYVIKAFEKQSDGLGFLKQILKKAHPKLKTLTDYKTMDKPSFMTQRDIHSFIAQYIDWLDKEKLINNRQYTDKENINFILSELDNRFHTAKTKIETRLNSIFANPSAPKPFPDELKISSELSIYIMDQIPEEEQSVVDFTNSIATINKMTQRKYFPSKSKQSSLKPSKDWSSNIKWELIPGAVCEACGQNNHAVYKTGCPALAIFSNCKKFYEKTPAKDILPVIDEFAKFKAEQREKQKLKRKDL